jgi:hypothetical protein
MARLPGESRHRIGARSIAHAIGITLVRPNLLPGHRTTQEPASVQPADRALRPAPARCVGGGRPTLVPIRAPPATLGVDRPGAGTFSQELR